MNWQTIFNPFSIFSEKQLAIAGISITIAGSLIGSFCNSSFNGTLDMHIAENPKLITVFFRKLYKHINHHFTSFWIRQVFQH